jgi:P-type conjugative transfer protein TrbJ
MAAAMKTLLRATVIVLALASTREARAQAAIYCVNCVTPVWQLPQWLQNFQNQVQMIQQQIMMVEYQIHFWESLIQNTIDLPERIFNDITGEINRLQNIVRQAEMIGQQTKFMIDHLGDASGFGGDLSDIPAALAQENNALANAMKIMGMAVRSSQDMQMVYSAQINTLQAQAPSGITQAVQIGNQIQATTAQQIAVNINTEAVSMQALATAELRKAHRETLLDSRALQDQNDAVAQECGYLTVLAPPACAGGGAGGRGGGGGGVIANANNGGGITAAQAQAINAAPNTP